jgi:hypothetical protein
VSSRLHEPHSPHGSPLSQLRPGTNRSDATSGRLGPARCHNGSAGPRAQRVAIRPDGPLLFDWDVTQLSNEFADPQVSSWRAALRHIQAAAVTAFLRRPAR